MPPSTGTVCYSPACHYAVTGNYPSRRLIGTKNYLSRRLTSVWIHPARRIAASRTYAGHALSESHSGHPVPRIPYTVSRIRLARPVPYRIHYSRSHASALCHGLPSDDVFCFRRSVSFHDATGIGSVSGWFRCRRSHPWNEEQSIHGSRIVQRKVLSREDGRLGLGEFGCLFLLLMNCQVES